MARWDGIRLRAQQVDMKWFADKLTIKFFDGYEPLVGIDGVLDRRTEAPGRDDPGGGGTFLRVADLTVWAEDFGPPPDPGMQMEIEGDLYLVRDAYLYDKILNIELQANDY